jgi:pyridoxamine 5'-phosphate oxidase
MGCRPAKAKPKAATMGTDPFALFDAWFAEARASEPNEPEAMAVATAGADGRPAVRMLLFKAHGPEGFTFYTHEGSAKGEDLRQNPQVALLFHWKSLCRQVRIEGSVERVSDAEADAYFASRARDSQLGAWASDQSRPLDNRATFEQRFDEAKRRFEGNEVPRPETWSGYRVVPDRIEFWTAREHRLHERRLFTRDGDGWSEGLLYP